MKKILLGLPLITSALLLAKPINLNVVHYNDHHSHLEESEISVKVDGISTKVKIGGYPELMSVIKNKKASSPSNTIVLHAGDALTGTLYFTLFGGTADAELMNETGIHYFTLGNHEFDAGNEGLKNFLDQLKVPVISANVKAPEGSILYDYWKPYGILNVEGEKVGIIGLDVTKKTKESSSPGKDIIFGDELLTAEKYVKILQDMGINKIIILSHAGVEKNLEIAQKVSGIDIIITGDTHTLMANETLKKAGLPVTNTYPVKLTSPSGEPVYVVEGWEYAKFIGELKASFDDNGVITKMDIDPVIPFSLNSSFQRKDKNGKKYIPAGEEKAQIIESLKKLPYFQVSVKDPKGEAMLKDFKAKKDSLSKLVVGNIIGANMPGGSDNRIPNEANPKGSIATRFIAETMLNQMRSFGENARLDLTIQNSGGVRTNIMPGQMTYDDAYTLLPFGNTLYLLEMTGAEVKQVIEDALQFALVDGSTGAFPYSAGMRYEANKTKDSNGKRIVKMEIQDEKTGEWKEIDENKTYLVGTNNYIARGQDGYKTFGKVLETRGGVDSYLPDAESLIKFLKDHPNMQSYTDSNVLFHYDK